MIHFDPRDLARPHPFAHFQLNRDVDRDGTVDIALMATFSAGVAGSGGYECEFQDSAGQTHSIRSDTGAAWIKANTERSYRARWRTLNWTSQPGPWSSYTSYVTPLPLGAGPATPTGGSLVAITLGFTVSWTRPTELDYAFTEIAVSLSSSSPSDAWVHSTTSTAGAFCDVYYPEPVLRHVHVRHVNTSGYRSNWKYMGSVTPLKVDEDYLQAGAAGGIAINNLGTSMGGNVNAGPGSATLLTLTFKCTSNTAGVTVNLGGYSTTVDFKDQQPFSITTVENGGGSFSSSKSGGGTQANVQLTATTIH